MKPDILSLKQFIVSVTSKGFLLTGFLLFFNLFSSGQSETHDFVTYDTAFITGTGSGTVTWTLRISRPKNMFTPNHPDTLSRPAIITMPGMGEVGTNPAKLRLYGPHYWMDRGWDGSVDLGNGKHYPIIITLVPSVMNVRPAPMLACMKILLNRFKIKRNSVHVAGLSMGGFTWGRFIAFAQYQGDETTMSMIKSYTALQGVANDLSIGYNLPGWSAFGHWAKKYGGRFFGLEGTNDGRGVYNPANNMRDSLPGSAYFSMEVIGGGGHCCWNTMYDPAQKDWLCFPKESVTSPNIGFNGMVGKDNRMGNYFKGTSIFQWMLRQGDTTLTGSTLPPATPPVININPVVNAGTDVTITLPVNSVQLKATATDVDGTVIAYSWVNVSGPSIPVFSNATISNPVVNNLLAGTYKLAVTVTDDDGAKAADSLIITVAAAPLPQLPTNGKQIKVNVFGGVNPYANVEWNNWNITYGSPYLKYRDGTVSAVTSVLSQSTGIGDNTVNYASGMAPSQVLRYTSYSTMARTLTIKGLAPAKSYALELYAGRSSNANNRTVFTVNTKADTIATYNNINEKAVFSGLIPNTKGELVISITRLEVYTYLNGFMITEETSATAGARSVAAAIPETLPEKAITFEIYPNPVRGQLSVAINNDYLGLLKVTMISMNGVDVRTVQISKTQKHMQTYINTDDLPSGNYIIRVEMGKLSGAKIFTRL